MRPKKFHRHNNTRSARTKLKSNPSQQPSSGSPPYVRVRMENISAVELAEGTQTWSSAIQRSSQVSPSKTHRRRMELRNSSLVHPQLPQRQKPTHTQFAIENRDQK
mmetsp:Transcript_21076/g.41342  ORF Transcript_21076/g.41342 Transcript_21076/m.41342 type:complete len:106 (+) Transcript_21076:1030-1347(+)